MSFEDGKKIGSSVRSVAPGAAKRPLVQSQYAKFSDGKAAEAL
jgi:hypothetical protein